MVKCLSESLFVIASFCHKILVQTSASILFATCKNSPEASRNTAVTAESVMICPKFQPSTYIG